MKKVYTAIAFQHNYQVRNSSAASVPSHSVCILTIFHTIQVFHKVMPVQYLLAIKYSVLARKSAVPMSKFWTAS